MFTSLSGELKHVKYLACYLYPSTNSTFTQTVRWARKPRWLPMAKSKLFRIPVRPVIPEEERAELYKLHANYNTYMRSVRTFFKEELIKEKNSLADLSSESSKLEEAADFQRCMEENDKWNAEVAVVREERLTRQYAEREENILNALLLKDEMKRKKMELAERKLREYQEISKTFITRDKLDEAIDTAVNSIVDYNYAIDYNGNIYPGREGQYQAEEKKDTYSI